MVEELASTNHYGSDDWVNGREIDPGKQVDIAIVRGSDMMSSIDGQAECFVSSSSAALSRLVVPRPLRGSLFFSQRALDSKMACFETRLMPSPIDSI